MSRDLSPLAVRMPSDLHERVREAAHRNRRSLNAELVLRIEQSFEHGEQPVLANPAPLQGMAPKVLRVAEDHPDLYRLSALWPRLDPETRAALIVLAQRSAP